MKLSGFATISLLLAISCNPLCGQQSNRQFDEPVFLKIGEKPMNADGGMMYPSPVLMDIDNDGDKELVIGTIFGGVYACENSSKTAGDPIWESPRVVKTIEDQPLKLNNW